MAAGFALPGTVFGHGWWLKDAMKMSKSKGNVFDPTSILKTFGADSLRYFLLREIPIGLDGNFSHEGFVHRVNSDLANDLGNLVQRTLTMIHSYFGGVLGEMEEEREEDAKIRHGFEELRRRVYEFYENYALSRALEEVWVYLNQVNKYLAENEPWKLSKAPGQKKRLGRILYQAAAAIRGISLLLYPVMPESAQKIWDWMGEEKPLATQLYSELKFEEMKLGQKIKEATPLFPRIEGAPEA
jgi:methionyl-tRNA synthetase